MTDITIIEDSYKKYIRDINKWMPEGIIDVDLNLLQRLGLLHYYDQLNKDAKLTRYFHVLESNEKITLINETFVVWIVPDRIGHTAITYTLIALNPAHPHLELVYSTTGVYNSSKLVLRILEKFLEEIQENEDIIMNLNKAI
jgi:hypothetical protein